MHILERIPCMTEFPEILSFNEDEWEGLEGEQFIGRIPEFQIWLSLREQSSTESGMVSKGRICGLGRAAPRCDTSRTDASKMLGLDVCNDVGLDVCDDASPEEACQDASCNVQSWTSPARNWTKHFEEEDIQPEQDQPQDAEIDFSGVYHSDSPQSATAFAAGSGMAASRCIQREAQDGKLEATFDEPMQDEWTTSTTRLDAVVFTSADSPTDSSGKQNRCASESAITEASAASTLEMCVRIANIQPPSEPKGELRGRHQGHRKLRTNTSSSKASRSLN